MSAEHLRYRSPISFDEVTKRSESLIIPTKPVWILGGMGPAATVDLFKTVIEQTPDHITIEKDQDHIEILIANTPQVPDRTAYVLYDLDKTGEAPEDPFPYLVRGVRLMASLGGGDFAIPCNTAHYFAPELQRYIDENNLNLKLINMVEETAKEVTKNNFPKGTKVGILATTGTLRSGLYHHALEKEGFESIAPTSAHQDDWVMEAIYGNRTGIGIKKGSDLTVPSEQLLNAALELAKQGAKVILTACTEIPLALRQANIPDTRLINPTSVLGNRLIERALSN